MNQRQQKKLPHHLFEAIPVGDTARVKAVLRAGADPERAGSEGITPLYEASVNGEAEIARLLLAAGASPDTESSGLGADGTPLCAAACWGHIATVRELLAHGADPNLREDHGTGWSPLDWALNGPHPETAGLLTIAGATPSGRTRLGV
jgi:ankyrin repeat protein